LSPRVGLKDSYLREALYHLRRNGWLTSLHRGLYAISTALPGITPAHEFEIAMALVEPAAISHWSALHYHGLTEEAPRTVFVLTTTEKSSVPRARRANTTEAARGYQVAGTSYQFVQVKPSSFFGVEKVWINDARVTITDPERTLLDGLSRPQYCADLAEVLHAFQVRAGNLDLKRIASYALRLDVATIKRLGWVLEKQGVASSDLEPLLQTPIKGYRKLDATGPPRGPYNRRWMLRENLPGRSNP